MKTFFTTHQYDHQHGKKTGILLVNLGTPDAPTPEALRRYLAEFLSDPRLTELPRLVWKIILHGIILRVRPKKSAAKYAEIWTEDGSPLLLTTQAQAQAIAEKFNIDNDESTELVVAMRYGQPSIAKGLEQLREASVQRLLILPLYPQYSATTTASTFDAVTDCLKKWRWLPDIRFISHYHDQPEYIHALAESIKNYWAQHGKPEKLLFSFHGIPQRFFLAGDPYHCECHKTARLVAEHLELAADSWQVVFQSRFGKETWLQPYTDETLKTFAQNGVKRVDVICPGFAADCLETLEEIDQENRALFLQEGGQDFHYIPALNVNTAHIDALSAIIRQHSQGWASLSTAENEKEAILRQQRKTEINQQLEQLNNNNEE